MFIKIKFIKNEKPSEREYTYLSQIPIEVGDLVELPSGGIGVVTEVNVPEEEVDPYKDKIKEISGRKESIKEKIEQPKKFKQFVHAILSNAKLNDIYELCEEYDLSEDETDECLRYVESKEGMNIMDL